MMNIIMWLCVIWLPLLICWMLNNESKMKKNLAVGVTLPFEAREDAEVRSRLKRFQRSERLVCIILILIALIGMFIKSFDVTMFAWGLWVLAAIVIPYIPYIFCNRDLKAMKRSKGWQPEKTEHIMVDTALLTHQRWISPVWFLLPMLGALLPYLWEKEFWILYVVDGISVLLFWLLYRYTYRNKSERIDENMERTRALTEIRRQNWGRIWILAALLSAAVSLMTSLLWKWPLVLSAVMVAAASVFTCAAVGVEVNTRRLQQELTTESGKGAYVDEDDNWIWGIFYDNPEDPKIFMNSRVGTNVSMNLAHPVGKICMGAAAVILLAIPFFWPITTAVVNHPPEIVLTETVLTASSGKKAYEIPVDEIENVELLEELPDQLVRVMGTGMENLLTGKFMAKDYGKLNVCLDPTVGPYIYIQAETGYLIGTRDTFDTVEIYRALNERT